MRERSSSTFRGQPELNSTGEFWEPAWGTWLSVISPKGQVKLGFYNQLYCLRSVGRRQPATWPNTVDFGS